MAEKSRSVRTIVYYNIIDSVSPLPSHSHYPASDSDIYQTWNVYYYYLDIIIIIIKPACIRSMPNPKHPEPGFLSLELFLFKKKILFTK